MPCPPNRETKHKSFHVGDGQATRFHPGPLPVADKFDDLTPRLF